MVIQYSTLKKLKLAVKRSRKTRKTAGKTRKIKRAKKLAKRSRRAVKSSNLKSGTNIGRLTFRQYVNAKRKAKQNEIREYEQKYLSRYKQPKSKKKAASSNLYKPEKPKPKRDMKKERKEYEKKYLAHYKQPKAKPKEKNNQI